MLNPTDQEVLASAAVIGRTFDFQLLSALRGLEERELVEVLRRAAQAQLISEVSPVQSWQATIREAERANQIFAFHEEHYYLNMAQSSLPDISSERLLLLQRLTILSLLVFDFNATFDWLAEVKMVSQHIGQPQRAALLMMRILLTSFLLLSACPPMPNIVAEVEALAGSSFESSEATAKDEDLLLASS